MMMKTNINYQTFLNVWDSIMIALFFYIPYKVGEKKGALLGFLALTCMILGTILIGTILIG